MYFNEEKNKTNLDYELKKKKNINLKYLLILILVVIIIIFGVVISKRIFKTELFLELYGDTDIVVMQHDSYEEIGFKAYDNRGNDLTEKVTITGDINTSVVGEYTITYSLGTIIKERTISVVALENQITYLILNGSATIFLKVGEEYREPGFTVIDNLEDNLEDKVNITGEVNTNVAGSYKLQYSITNKSNITITEERTIIVMDSDVNITYAPTNITNQNITININVTDNYFDYILLPDGQKSINRMTTYQVINNGNYKFLIYSKDGSYKEQIIEINNIDKEAPTGSCSGYYKNGKSYITIDANDDKDIAKYIINNETYTSNQITYNRELTTIQATIYDKANNVTNISCKLKNKNTIYSAFFGVKTYSDNSGNDMSYWLYVPENATDNMPMIIFLHGSGEAGNDFANGTTKAITWGPGFDIKKNNAKFNAIILMPQSKSSWNSNTLKAVIEISNQIANQYQVNKQQISLAGFSLGCIAIPDLLGLYPNYFSAVVPIECQRPTDMTAAKKYVNTPTWTFASQSYTHTALQKLTNNINQSGGSAKHSYYANMGHTGLVGYNNYSIFTDQELNLVSWMTSQKRK